VGDSVVIQGVESTEHGLERRLEHVGFLPGTVVRVERRAPLGDPTVYELRGFRITLRKDSAQLIDVTDAIGAIDVVDTTDGDASSETEVDP